MKDLRFKHIAHLRIDSPTKKPDDALIITADDHQFIVNKIRIPKEGSKDMAPALMPIAFVTSVHNLVNWIGNKGYGESFDLNAVKSMLDQIIDRINELISLKGKPNAN